MSKLKTTVPNGLGIRAEVVGQFNLVTTTGGLPRCTDGVGSWKHISPQFEQVDLEKVGRVSQPHFFRGGAFVVWCAAPYAGIFATAQQQLMDLEGVREAYKSFAPNHGLVFVDARAFGTEGSVFEAMLNSAPTISEAAKSTRQAVVVLPPGWTRTWWLGALELSLWGPTPIKAFTTADEAWEELGAPEPLRVAVEQLHDKSTFEPQATAARAADQMRAALERQLRANPTLSIESVASTLGCSPRSLQRTLRAVGDSFASARVRVRVETASVMLIQSDSKVEAIASTVGFRSRSHFVGWFRRITGLTPQEFRRLRRASAVP